MTRWVKEQRKNKASFKGTSDAPSLARVERSIDTLCELHKGNSEIHVIISSRKDKKNLDEED